MKKAQVVALVVVAVAVVGIVVLATRNVRPYVDVDDVVGRPERYDGRRVQIIGIVEGFSGGHFNLTSAAGTGSVFVNVTGVNLPAELANGVEVVVEGTFRAPSTLDATLILTQCSQAPNEDAGA